MYNLSNNDEKAFYVLYDSVNREGTYLTDDIDKQYKEYKELNRMTSFVFDNQITEAKCDIYNSHYKYFWMHLISIDYADIFGLNKVNVIYLPSIDGINYINNNDK